YIADTDPLGTNPDRVPQVFAVNRDGSFPIQLTSATSATQATHVNELSRLDVDISDEGSIVLFKHQPGTFVILDDGTGLREVEAGPVPYLSGNGLHVTSRFGDDAIVVDPWHSLIELSQPGTDPTITSDGSFIYFVDDRLDPTQNPDGGGEIWKSSLDGSIVTPLTATTDVTNEQPIVAGGGSRIAFTRGGTTTYSLRAIDFRGDNEVVLAEWQRSFTEVVAPDITPDGTRIVYNLEGTLMRYDPAEGVHHEVPLDPQVWPEAISITGDGETIVLQSYLDPLGLGNDSGLPQAYAVEADGTGLRVLSGSFVPHPGAWYPVIAVNGSWVVFMSDNDLYRVRPDGTELLQITNLGTNGGWQPRLSADGEWVVFAHDGINRMRIDGSGLQKIVPSIQFETYYPDISGDGNQVVWAGETDPVGTNPDGNVEVFHYDVQNDTITQLTDTTAGNAFHPRITEDGAWVYFDSSSPFFDENPQGRNEWFRYEVATGRLERAGGIRRGPSEVYTHFVDQYWHVAVDATGDRAAFAAVGDWAGTNPDYSGELYLADYRGSGRIEASKQAPTLVTWEADPRYVRYDIIRGDLANVGYDAGTITLGPVACLESASPDTDTRGFEDPAQPGPGEVLFYVFRGTQGVGDAVNDWGRGSGAIERVPASGACSP
ncbi:MAG TPA: hypothetical protein VD788_02660, partial [Candidatus Polarisedimenticolaceae bacterium]|nr:hypothetical protein [Candidatus Polarisedimenticolaceae bacterium]